MMSATLFREGPDLDALLAELDAEHPGRVSVVDVEYGRAGGVLGFFAQRRVGVHYRLTDAQTAAAAPAAATPAAATPALPASFDDLVTAADASEERRAEPAAAAIDDEPDETKLEFARMLLEMATAKAAERRAATEPAALVTFDPPAFTPSPAPLTSAPPAADPAPAAFAAFTAFAAPSQPEFVPPAPEAPAPRLPRPAGAHRSHAEPEHSEVDQSWGEYALRRRLVEVGVPVQWIPDGADNAYWVVEQLTRRVSGSPSAAVAPGEVIVVAGPADAVLEAAHDLAARLRIDAGEVYAAGCRGDVPAERRLEVWSAGAAAAQCRTRGTAPLIVAVALDGSAADAAEWGRQVVRALVPDRVHVVVDAGRKSTDARRTIEALPQVHSLFVTGAARTASPASVWELGMPIEMLDGRPATQGGWAALLIDALAALDTP